MIYPIVPFKSGSEISPFQPTTVRGFQNRCALRFPAVTGTGCAATATGGVLHCSGEIVDRAGANNANSRLSSPFSIFSILRRESVHGWRRQALRDTVARVRRALPALNTRSTEFVSSVHYKSQKLLLLRQDYREVMRITINQSQ